MFQESSAMDADELRLRRQLRDDFLFYAPRCLTIVPKKGAFKRFHLNTTQQKLHAATEEQRRTKGRARIIILKGRQEGCSTYVEGRFYWRVTQGNGLRAFILTHQADATKNLFEMAQRFHDNCPDLVKPHAGYANSKELIFDVLGSGYKVGTAGNKGVGRSSTIHLFHGSEVAFWENAEEHAKGVLQAIPRADGTEVFLESTANGIGNYFYHQWQLAEAGESEFKAVFLPWMDLDEYSSPVPKDFIKTDEELELVDNFSLTDSQLVWRREKIAEFQGHGKEGRISFMQEYPCCPAEAFQASSERSFIQPQTVLKARKCEIKGDGPLILGVDPARSDNGDYTGIIKRKGRSAYAIERFKTYDLMEIVGRVGSIIKSDKPARVFVDVTGLGAGVADRLREMYGRIIVAVNFGESPLDKEKYRNKRAEMWALMKEWLLEQPASIPDDDGLHGELISVQWKPDSLSRLTLEPKEHTVERGVRSPDVADALALTFAYPVSSDADTDLVIPNFGYI